MSHTLGFSAGGGGSSAICGWLKARSERLIFSSAPAGRDAAKKAGVSGTSSMTSGIMQAVTTAPNRNTARQS